MFDEVDEEFFAREAELWHTPSGETFDDLEPAAPSSPARRSKRPPPRAATGSASRKSSRCYFRTQTRSTEPCGPAKRSVSAFVSLPTSGEPSSRVRGKRSVQPREKMFTYG